MWVCGSSSLPMFTAGRMTCVHWKTLSAKHNMIKVNNNKWSKDSDKRPHIQVICVFGTLDHARRVFTGVCQYAKFDWIRCSSFDNIQVSILSAIVLKCVFMLQKRFLGIPPPLYEAVSTWPKNSTSLSGNTSHDVYVVEIRPRMRTGRNKQLFPMLFNGADNPENCPFPLRDLHPQHNSLGPPDSAPKMASRSVLPFSHSSQTCPTDRQRNTHTHTVTTLLCV